MGIDNSMKPEDKLRNFKSQIDKDLLDIKNEYERLDPNTKNNDYSFLYWVLLKLYNVDDENIKDNITEYNDKSIDCFVHFEETKELFIIQCKHYNEDTKVIRNMVADFLKTPLAILDKGNYKKSIELQKIYNKAIKDHEYKIYLQFYTTNTKYSVSVKKAVCLILDDFFAKHHFNVFRPRQIINRI